MRWLLPMVFLLAAVTGCTIQNDWTDRIESRTPERLRGVAISYDISKLITPTPEPTKLPNLPGGWSHRPERRRVPMTVWWMTADGQLHSETRPADSLLGYSSRYAGAVWMKVTPVGSPPPLPATRPITAKP